jgi:hypothetical protein
MKTALVALAGLAGCGKTTVALGLVKNHGFHRISFADPLREMGRAFGLTSEEMSTGKMDPLARYGGKTPRQILQSLGTEWGRQMVDPEVWVNATRGRILDVWRDGGEVVIDDCRFDNEAAMVKDLGGRVVVIERAGLTRMAHASEAGISDHLVDARWANDFASAADAMTFARGVL